jgi:hypothetical protein
VTITRGRLCQADQGRRIPLAAAWRQGRARGALRGEDVVEHFFTTTSHHWLLFFTNLGRVYRAKAYELPDAGRDAKGQHVANLLAFQPEETSPRCWRSATTQRALSRAGDQGGAGEEDPARRVRLAAQGGSSRSTCATATSSSARAGSGRPTTCCWSPARASRCGSTPTTTQLRPMGRPTSGRHRDEVPPRRLAAGDERHPGGDRPGRLRRLRVGLAKRTKASRVDRQGARHSRRRGRQAVRSGWRPRRGAHRRRRTRCSSSWRRATSSAPGSTRYGYRAQHDGRLSSPRRSAGTRSSPSPATSSASHRGRSRLCEKEIRREPGDDSPPRALHESADARGRRAVPLATSRAHLADPCFGA